MRTVIFDQDYIIDWLQETAWALVIGGGAVALQILVATDVEQVEDWQTWGVALGVAVGRAATAVLGNAARKLLASSGD